MVNKFNNSIFLALGLIISAFSGCDPNHHQPIDHSCNFPDIETANNLRGTSAFKVIDKITSLNLVDTTKNAVIQLDSVVVLDENLNALPYHDREYSIDNWIIDELAPYHSIPFDNDAEALLALKSKTFYLKTS